MKPGHTPGDWKLELSRWPTGKLAWRPFIYAVGAPEGSRHIAELCEENPNLDANGRLIAAAPKMRASLQALLGDDLRPENLGERLDAARALLAEIDGEGL
jgi:hypothetical protein